MGQVDGLPNYKQLVKIIVDGLRGWGAALRELRAMANLSQEQVAMRLGRSKTVISHWEHERHRPSPEVLRNALIAMQVDARLVYEQLGEPLEAGDALEALHPHTNARSAALKVAELILSMSDRDPDEVEAMLHHKLDVLIVASQGAKALAGDSKAASFFLQRGDRIRREQQRARRGYQTRPMDTQPSESVASDYDIPVPVPAPSENTAFGQARPKGRDED